MSKTNHNDDDLERDPQLARLLAAGSADDVPPPALDAAILAAARREVGARPQALGGGGSGGSVGVGAETVASPRAKRNWYVPVSVAAVLVMSVSLVTLMKEERGDELAQPPTPSLAKTPKSAPAPAPETGVVADAAQPALKAEESVTAQRSETRESLPVEAAREKRADFASERADAAKAVVPAPPSAPAPAATPSPVPPGQPAPAWAQERTPTAPSVGAAANTVQPPFGAAPSASPAPVPPPPAATAPPPPRPEPFPATREREAQAPRDTSAARARVETDTPPAMADVAPAPQPAAIPAAPPMVAARPAARPAEAREPAAAVEDSRAAASRAPMAASGAAEKPLARPMAKLQSQQAARPTWLVELDNQPPEKWLERLAEFKRDGRGADAEILLNEFRRRFPQHPASAR